MNKRKIKHDFDNSLMVFLNMSASIDPIINRILSYLEFNNIEVVSLQQIKILKKSMRILNDEVVKLKKFSDIMYEEENIP